VTQDGSPFQDGLLFAVRCFAAIRLAFMPVALVTHETIQRPPLRPDAFYLVLGLGTLYALVLVVLALRRPEPLLQWRRLGVLDLALVAALVLYSGASQSPLRFAYVAIPLLVAFVVRPDRAAGWALATLASYLVISFAIETPIRRGAPQATGAEAVAVAFAALTAIVLSAVLLRLRETIDEHARRAAALAAGTVRIEARERRKLADALHDHAVQHLVVASREVTAAVRGEHARLEHADAALRLALEELRGEIFDLYSHVLDHAGLEGAVSELARRAAERGGFRAHVEIDPAAAGIDDVAVVSVLRELLANAAKHAAADRVDIWVSNQAGACVLVEVRDDGCGFEPLTPDQAARARQFGLHAAGERLRALGGSLDVLSVPGSGTSATARIPIGPAGDDRAHSSPATRAAGDARDDASP